MAGVALLHSLPVTTLHDFMRAKCYILDNIFQSVWYSPLAEQYTGICYESLKVPSGQIVQINDPSVEFHV